MSVVADVNLLVGKFPGVGYPKWDLTKGSNCLGGNFPVWELSKIHLPKV